MARGEAAPRRAVNLALQGGGAHGAFTWGVLDRLLECPEIEIAAISGTSAGAMNAVVAAQGLQTAGPEGARAALRRFWRAVSRAARASPIRRSPLDVLLGRWSIDGNPAYVASDLVSRLASPYDLNPLGFNPLRDLLAEQVDFDAVRACDRVRLHICATDVETGRPKVFERHEMTLDMVMASACLPQLYQAVEVGGRFYWDGGYSGNPVLWPFYESPTADIVIVQINPVLREGAPRAAREIANRVNEITFNAALLRELRAIEFVHRLLEAGALPRDRYRDMRLHMIEARKQLRPLGASSKLNAEWPFLRHLFGIGRAAAEAWLGRDFVHVGERSSLDMRRMFQGETGRSPEPVAVEAGGAAEPPRG
jgi:NTE family protein